MIAITTADVVLQALAYDDSFEAATLYGLLAMGRRGEEVQWHLATDRPTE